MGGRMMCVCVCGVLEFTLFEVILKGNQRNVTHVDPIAGSRILTRHVRPLAQATHCRSRSFCSVLRSEIGYAKFATEMSETKGNDMPPTSCTLDLDS